MAALMGLIVAGLFTKFMITPEYEATTKLYVQESANQIVDLSAISLSKQLTSDYIEVFSNWHVHDEVINALSLEYSYKEIQNMLAVNTLNDTRIISITVTSTDPKEAYNIARAYAAFAPAFIEEKMLTSRPTVFEEARIPTRPSSPNLMMNMFVGTFLGGVIAVAIVFIQFVSDDRIRNAELLQKRLGLATLGMVPLQTGGNELHGNHGGKRNGKGAKKA